MKFKALTLALLLTTSLFVGCGKNNNSSTDMNDNKTKVESNSDNSDVLTSPSRATDVTSLEKALKESWIVILESDVTTDKDVTLEGGFKKDEKETSRVLAMYKSDENKNVVETYTLTTPKLIVKDQNAKIEGGTLKGDLYIEANGVTLENVKVDGNIYYSKEEYKDSFHMDDKSSVTGVQELK